MTTAMPTSTIPSPPIGPVDLAAERRVLGPALQEAIERVIASGAYVLGPEVAAFESEFAVYQHARHGIGVNSGTDALVLGMHALGVTPGSKVLTSPFTFFASAGTIAWIGAKPSFVDIDPDTALMRTDQVAAAIDSDTRCLMPVHLYGQLCDLRALRAICDQKGIALLEDGAQCHGAERDGVRCGELGDAAAFSFYPTKNLGAIGEGGMILTQDDGLAAVLRRLRDHGSSAKYVHSEVGTNSRLQGIQGAVLRLKLPHLDTWNARRRAIAASYDEAFANNDYVRPLQRPAGSVHVYHQYAVRILGEPGSRDRVAKQLGERGISAAVHYPRPVHVQEAARDWGYGQGDFPGAELLAQQVLCLPVHPFLSDGQVARVADELLRSCSQL